MRGWNGTEGLTGRHRGRPLRWVLGTHFLLLSALVSTPATPQSLRDSSPRRGAKGAVQPLCTIPKSLPRSAALFRVVQRRRGSDMPGRDRAAARQWRAGAEGVARLYRLPLGKRNGTVNSRDIHRKPYHPTTKADAHSASAFNLYIYSLINRRRRELRDPWRSRPYWP